jgi:hypothetical protein
MQILNRGKEKNTNQLFVGAYVPDHIAHYFALLSVAKGVSKSELFRKKLDDWYQNSKAVGSESLINNIVHKAVVAWRIVRVSGTVTRSILLDFDDQLAKELRNKGVSEGHIEMILKRFHHEKDKRIDYEAERTDEDEK